MLYYFLLQVQVLINTKTLSTEEDILKSLSTPFNFERTNKMEITDILSSLVSTPSVSGNEKEIGEVLKGFCPKGYTIERDNLGSFIFAPEKREKYSILLQLCLPLKFARNARDSQKYS